MSRIVKPLCGALLGIAISAQGVLAAEPMDKDIDALVEEIETGLRPLVRTAGDDPVRWTLQERMAVHGVPGVSIAIIKDGEVLLAKGFGVKNVETGEPVDEQTVFSVGSLSKVGAATTTLKLVADGTLDLDRPVNEYLASWQVPDNEFTADRPVTLRGLLSHTAGLTVHGFPDFLPGKTLPTVVETLKGTGPAKTPAVEPFYVPGTRWRYSGGGTTVEQLILTDVMDKSFEAVTAKTIFGPLGMTRSTYENPLPASHGNIAYAHNKKGKLVAKPRGWHAFPEMAASGLWTTPTDYAAMMIALMDSYHGEEGSFLPQALAQDMMTEVGVSPFGLGPQLVGSGQHRRFHHAGANESYRAWMEGFIDDRNGFVIFTNGEQGSRVYYEVRRAICDVMEWPCHQEITVPNNLNKDDLKSFVGTYNMPSDMPASSLRAHGSVPVDGMKVLRQRDGGLAVKILGQYDNRTRTLIQTGPLTFLVENTPNASTRWLAVSFQRGHDGDVNSAILTQNGSDITLTREQ